MRPNSTTTHMILATSMMMLPALACDSSDGDGETRLRVVMQTPPTNELASPDVALIDGIEIDVAEISLHEIDGGGWISFEPAEDYQTIHFGDDPLVIGDGYLPEGDYDQLRVVVADARITIDGVEHPLEIPSGTTSGFKIHGEFCVYDHDDDDDDDDAHDHDLYLSWDVDEGIRHNSPRGYWLVPSVHLEGAPGCHGHDDDGDSDDDA